ncbi:hypothetical protein CSC94_05835 [Zhengella mangrovi]|uniref:Ammonia monooxygenase n=1 Tax=Zhengella mangrovi TaxID=1982044 RepID=A0A2G1QRT6_9HYPH|nr:DUF6527 family protein [Zhengella mangrovi]PHP68170.1 hypothetical protein CSC94_05835 [Zhengella mangrovi]
MKKVNVNRGLLSFHCPGCGWDHDLNISPERPRPRWEFNGDLEKPTLKPSINATVEYPAHRGGLQRCHSFVTDGRIQFLADCTHDLAGFTVDLPRWTSGSE